MTFDAPDIILLFVAGYLIAGLLLMFAAILLSTGIAVMMSIIAVPAHLLQRFWERRHPQDTEPLVFQTERHLI